MPENPTKKSRASTPEKKPIDPRIEQAPDIGTPEDDADKLLALLNETVEDIKDRDQEMKTSLENRTSTLPHEIQSEADKISSAAKIEISQNEAELLALQDAANKELKELEDSFSSEDKKMGGGGPLEVAVVETTSAQSGSEQTTPVESQPMPVQNQPKERPRQPEPTSAPQPVEQQTVNTRQQEAPAEIVKTREQLIAERRALRREWEKEATKQTERQMGKEEQKKYKQLLEETNEKKIKMKPEERQKLISDVGFTDAEYQLMKTGAKPWALNAIWKRLGELDREIVETPPAEHAPVVQNLPQEAPRGNPARAVAGSFEVRTPSNPTVEEAGITIDAGTVKVQELADAARILNNALSKLDKNYADNNTAILEQINKNPAAVKTFVEETTQTLNDWQNVTNIRDIIPALAPAYGAAEDLAKLSNSDLEAIRQHTIDKLIETIRLAEHTPGTKAKIKKEPSEKDKEKNEIKDAMMSEISHAIKFDDAWYQDKEEETLKRWEEAKNSAEVRVLLKEKLWPVADDMKLLKNADLDLIQEEVVEYLIPIVKAVREAKPPEAPSIGFAEKVKEHRRQTLTKDIRDTMKKRIELRQAVRRGEKGAEKKLRTVSNRLEKLRFEKREMRKEK